MFLALGAASSAIEGLFGLVSPKQTQSAGSGQDQPNLFAFQADASTSTGTGAGPAAGGGAQQLIQRRGHLWNSRGRGLLAGSRAVQLGHDLG